MAFVTLNPLESKTQLDNDDNDDDDDDAEFGCRAGSLPRTRHGCLTANVEPLEPSNPGLSESEIEKFNR